MNDNTENNAPEQAPDGKALCKEICEPATKLVKELLTSATIPAAILNNAVKAFGQICTAAADLPVAYLEGVTTEMRASTQARVKIISTGADQIAAQMEVDPECARVAAQKYGQKIIREQINLDKVSEAAAEQIRQDVINCPVEEDSKDASPISDDWLNQFEREASQMSSEDMQLLFGRILAGEIQKPASFSIKTVKLLGSLDATTAKLFRRFCSLSLTLISGDHVYDARVVSLNGSAASNSLQSYGLSFDQLNILQENGLIVSDYNCYMDFGMSIADVNRNVLVPFKHQGKNWGLACSSEEHRLKSIRLNGVALSRSGKELWRIVDTEPAEKYTADLIAYFEKRHLNMVGISNLN